MNPDDLAELEEERRFLLTSIRDLEREHEAGDVDEHDFTTLRDGYVARAATVLREIDDGRRALPSRAERPWWRRLAVPVATLVVAGGLGLAVANFAGQRLPGQGLTGGQTPDEVASLLAEARQVLGTDPVTALSAYEKVLELEPDNVEAVTYRAWLHILDAYGAGDMAAIEAEIPELQRAIAIDDTYADAHCLLAVATGRFLEPPDEAIAATEAQACLDLDPPNALAASVQGLLDGTG